MKDIFKWVEENHQPYPDGYDCELCGRHETWTCSCSWNEWSLENRHNWAGFEEWWSHIKEAYDG